MSTDDDYFLHETSEGREEKDKDDKKKQKKKYVRFSKTRKVRRIPHINDMTREQIVECWMQPEDFRSIRLECRAVVKAVDSGRPLPEGYFLRGLDQQTMEYRERSDGVVRRVYDAVFRVQQYQKELRATKRQGRGITDLSLLMARVAAQNSEPAVIAAQLAAMSDLFSSFKDTSTKRCFPTIVEPHTTPTPETSRSISSYA